MSNRCGASPVTQLFASLQILRDTSLQKVKRNQNCLEPCVRQLVSCLESDTVRIPSGVSLQLSGERAWSQGQAGLRAEITGGFTG